MSGKNNFFFLILKKTICALEGGRRPQRHSEKNQILLNAKINGQMASVKKKKEAKRKRLFYGAVMDDEVKVAA